MSSNEVRHAAIINEDLAVIVRKIVVDNLEIEARHISDHARLFDLGADWLDRVELILAVEDYFDIELADDGIENIVVVGDLIHLVEAHRPH
jgi:acyl carrier protein